MGLDIYLGTKNEIVAGNFRKINCLVTWFENNLESIKNGEMENVTLYPITKAEVKSLLTDVTSVLQDSSLAPKVLPTCSGFFFGSTEYDAYYFNDLQFVKDELINVLTNFDFVNETLNAYIWY